MVASELSPSVKYDLIVRTGIITGADATTAPRAIPAANPNQMPRIVGFFPNGEQVTVAQRPGKGGVDFNKLLSGKAYAVAADGLSPVYEKGADKKPTTKQKMEEGNPLYSTSGFYLLSSKEYPALQIFEALTHLLSHGEKALVLSYPQLENAQTMILSSELDLELLCAGLEGALADANNLVVRHDAAINRKRRRQISRMKEDAEEAEKPYNGVEFKELAVSKKDGSPMVYLVWQSQDGSTGKGIVLRESEYTDDERRVQTAYHSATEAVEHFKESGTYAKLLQQLAHGREVSLTFVQGHLMRTSVSFKRRCEIVLQMETPPVYGDAVYITAAAKAWVPGLVAVMHSMHPSFPSADYDSHHYVAALRQAEVGMNKTDGKWSPPAATTYDIATYLRMIAASKRTAL